MTFAASELPLLLHPLIQLQKLCIASSHVAPLQQYIMAFKHKTQGFTVRVNKAVSMVEGSTELVSAPGELCSPLCVLLSCLTI